MSFNESPLLPVAVILFENFVMFFFQSSDSEFNPEVINELSTSVHMLTAKVNELLKKNRKYQKSHSSRSTRSSSSDGGSVYREEIDHLYYSYYHRDSAAERSKRVCT